MQENDNEDKNKLKLMLDECSKYYCLKSSVGARNKTNSRCKTKVMLHSVTITFLLCV